MKRGLILSTLILLVLGGCRNPLTDFVLFNAYRGVNLMAGVEFEIEPIGVWERATSSGDDFLHADGTGLETAGPSGAPAIRLESLNQLNQGHFPAGLPDFWDTTPSINPMNVDPVSPSGIRFTRTSQAQFISLDLTDDRAFTVTPTRQFRINIQFQMDSAIADEEFFGVVQRELNIQDVLFSENTPNLVAKEFPMGQPHLLTVIGIIPDTGAERIVVGGELNRITTIQSIRILEDNLDRYYIQTVLPKVPTSDGLPFQEQGRFKFNFYARRQADLEPGQYHADVVTVELAGVDKHGDIYKTESFTVDVSNALEENPLDPGSHWTRYTALIPSPLGTELRNLQDDDDALIIRIYPFKAGIIDVGIIQLSNPELLFFPR